MPLAVTHVLGAIILLDIFRHYVIGWHKFPRYLVVVGGIAGLIPDIDIPISWILSLLSGQHVDLHGTFTHSFIFPIIFLVVGIILHYRNKKTWSKIFYVIAAGWTLHASLDCLFGGYKAFLWPLGINTLPFCPEWSVLSKNVAAFDAILLVVWLIHEEVHNRIKSYV